MEPRRGYRDTGCHSGGTGADADSGTYRLGSYLADSASYPDSFLKALRRNPEIADFVEAWPDMPAEASGGIRLMEKQQETPLFLQWDSRWGYVPYGHSNVGISGCGPTCLSMVLFSMTRDETLTPDTLAARAMEDGYYVEDEGTSWLFMRDICQEYGIKAEQYPYMEEQSMSAELEEGKLIICAMGPGDFTDDGHFILLTGYAGGQFTINDPFSKANSSKKMELRHASAADHPDLGLRKREHYGGRIKCWKNIKLYWKAEQGN